MRTIDCVLVGLGNLGPRLLGILQDKESVLADSYGLRVRVVAAVDSLGAAIQPDGLPLDQIVALKEAGRSVADLPESGRPGMKAIEVVQAAPADLLLEASPVSLQDGEPGLSCVRTALSRGMHVVTPNKGPLVLAYDELMSLALEQSVSLRFCGTVAGGLPALNLGHRDLAGATIHLLESCPNLSSNYVLFQMLEGATFDEAVAVSRREGVLEADPSLDVEGWDAANKLVILSNHVLGYPAKLEDVQVEGITRLSKEDLETAREAGDVVLLLAAARLRPDGTYDLQVGPRRLSPGHPLAHLRRKEMGVVYHTDIYGVVTATILEENPIPSAASMFRDMLEIFGESQNL